MGSSNLGQGNAHQGFANSQILNQQQLGIFKSSGPVRATAFDYKMDQYHGIQSSSHGMGSRKGMSGGSNSNTHKTYKRGQGSLGPSQNNASGLRPGTAQKRPASPNAQGLAKQGGHNVNGPSPYSFGLAQQHNNLLGGNMTGNQQHGFNG